jgi:hypothetical protein
MHAHDRAAAVYPVIDLHAVAIYGSNLSIAANVCRSTTPQSNISRTRGSVPPARCMASAGISVIVIGSVSTARISMIIIGRVPATRIPMVGIARVFPAWISVIVIGCVSTASRFVSASSRVSSA